MSEKEKTEQDSPEGIRHKTGARIEEFIISNSNGNGINPNPIESGDSSEWDKGIQENEDYQADALDESDKDNQ